MRVRLFDIVKGKAKITDQVKSIGYLSCLVDKYGEKTALKIFQIFDKVYDQNPDTNPYTHLNEESKYETILRTMYPKLVDEIDLDDEDIEKALDLVGELYETPKYRAYKALKTLYDRIIEKMKYADISLTKEGGNMGEINKALKSFEDLNIKLAKAYKELEQEMNIKQTKGNVKARRKVQEELD